MKFSRWLPLFVLFLLFLPASAALETIPPKPDRYFNDYANVVDPAVVGELNSQLEQFERDSSNQVRVVIYPKMLSDSSIEDYTVRVAQSWHAGVKGKDNGTILFVFTQDRSAYIQVGYGLEGALPDATCKEIIDQGIAPLFKKNDYNNAMRGAVAAIIAATKGEYKGTGQTKNEQLANGIVSFAPCAITGVILFVLLGIILAILHNFGGTFYQNHVRSISTIESCYMSILQVIFFLLSMLGSSRSSSSGGGSSGGGGGGFSSSGGGSFGGGGAGGSW